MLLFSLAGVLTDSKLVVAGQCLTSIALPPRSKQSVSHNQQTNTQGLLWSGELGLPADEQANCGECEVRNSPPELGGGTHGRGTDHSNKLPFLFQLVDLGFHYSIPRFPTIMVINLISSSHLNFWQFCAFILVLLTKSINKLIILLGITQCLFSKALITPHKQVSMAFISFPP